MSVDAKLFVTCGKDKLFEVGNSVSDALNKYVRNKTDDYWKNHTDAISRLNFLWSEDYKTQAKMFGNGVSISSHGFDVISYIFKNGDENKRVLSMFPDCSSDASDVYEGEKIIFSIGHWGSCDEIMKVVAETVKPFGDVYYDHNDCDDEGFVKLH